MTKVFESLIKKPLKQLDNSTGKVFKISFFYIFKFLAVVVVALGLYLIVSGLFGKTGYFAMLRGYFSGFELTRSIICFILTLALNFIMFFAVAGVLWYRANDFKTYEFNNVLFIFPRLIKIFGEAIFLLPAIASTISFIAILFAAIPYAPIEGLISITGGFSTNLINSFIGNTFSAMFVQNFHDYISLLFSGGLIGLITGFALSFAILLGTYMLAEFFEIIFKFLMRKNN
ncbi:MAG TPA: hypothetical protein PLY32_01115 [Salinivirgaceae bacterium]|nr:hypothetical protein [Salinivirgaceae bacterium]HQA75696.1 hypothetical protein [Salinivirgaceae bacterium]